jgi:hypothetical protein
MNYQENGYYDGSEMDAATFAAILRGDYGPEAQAEALEAANLQYEGAQGEYQDPAQQAWAQDFIGQSHQLEKRLGRELTGAEFKALADDQQGAAYPDIHDAWSRVLDRNVRNPEDRRAIAAEVYDEDMELKQAEEQLEAEGRESANLNVQGAQTE